MNTAIMYVYIGTENTIRVRRGHSAIIIITLLGWRTVRLRREKLRESIDLSDDKKIQTAFR